MTRSARGILVYEFGGWEKYLIRSVFPEARRLKAMPCETAADVLSRLPGRPGTFVFHVGPSQSSRFPLFRTGLLSGLRQRQVNVVNALVTDVTRRRLYDVCKNVGLPNLRAPRAGSPSEWLFVKSNLNYGGELEATISSTIRRRLGISSPPRHLRGSRDYRVLQRQQIPDRWWTDLSLSIERFVRNRHHRYYRAYVAGPHVLVSESASDSVIQKMGHGEYRISAYYSLNARSVRLDGRSSRSDAVVWQVTRLIRGMGLEFGAVDALEADDGTFYLCDINATPYWGEDEPEITTFLRQGLMQT